MRGPVVLDQITLGQFGQISIGGAVADVELILDGATDQLRVQNQLGQHPALTLADLLKRIAAGVLD